MNPRFTASIQSKLTARTQHLVDCYEATFGATGPGCCPAALATVLTELAAYAIENKEDAALLRSLASELRGEAS